MVQILLDSGANVSQSCRELEVLMENKRLNKEIKLLIEKEKKWERIKGFVKLYKERDHSTHYPKELSKLNPLLVRKMLEEYM